MVETHVARVVLEHGEKFENGTAASWRRSLARRGVPDGLPRDLATRLRVTNLYALTVGAVVAFLYAPGFLWLLDSPALALGCLAVAAACALVPVLHGHGLVRGGRYWMLGVSNVSVLTFSVLLGPDAGIHLLFFVTGCSPLALLDPRPRPARWLFVALPVVGLGLALTLGRVQGPLLVLDRGARLTLEVALHLTVLGLLATVMLYFLRLSERTQRELVRRHREATHELDEALRRSEARYALASRGTRDGVWEWDLAHNRLYCATRWCEMLGLPAKEATSEPHASWLDRIHPDDRPDVDAAVAAHLAGRSERLHCEYRIRHEDGGYLWVATRGQAVRGPGGPPDRMAGWMSDITEQRRAEQRLKQSEERFRQLLRQAADALLLLDERGTILDANEQASRDLGYTRSELLGARVFDLDAAGVLRNLLDDLDALEARGHDTLECPFRRSDGSQYPVELRVGIVHVDGARHVLTLARNIEKRRAMEAKLMFTDRMVSVGTLAAGVAHEINNPLTYLGMNLEYLQANEAALTAHLDAPLATRISQAIARAMDGSERVATIVRDLKTFARGEDEGTQIVHVNRVLESTLHLADEALRRRAQVHTRLRDVPGVRASEARLGQVFMNLVLNAAQALEGQVGRDPQIWVETALNPDGSVGITVRDNGPGISAENLSRIFDPFFTTKPVGVGTGLGLYICQNIVRSFEGEMNVQSQPGEGTQVTLRIPRASASKPDLPAADMAV